MRRRFRRSTSDPTSDDTVAPERSDGGSDDRATDPGSAEGAAASFDALLATQLDQLDHLPDADLDPVPDGDAETGTDTTVDPSAPNDDETEASVVLPAAAAVSRSMATETESTSVDPARSAQLAGRAPGRTPTIPAGPGDFWDHYDRASAEAELAVVPPAAVVAVVGPLHAALPAIRRCRDRHWMGDCDVFVLTQQPVVELQGPGEPPWTAVAQPSDLVAVLAEGGSDFPLLVLDVPCDLPAFVRPLVARLRESGVGLVHYVLDGEPVDEDLATWHGELGRPSVLDLAGPVPSHRVLELVDRGEPVVSVAGRDLSPELLLALRLESPAPGVARPGR